MKFSINTKNKVLKNILSSEINPKNFTVEDIQKLQNSLKSLSKENLTQYLHILEWEQLIEINFDINNNVSSISILPNAFSRYSTTKSENTYKHITLFFAVISTLCAIIQVIDLFLRA